MSSWAVLFVLLVFQDRSFNQTGATCSSGCQWNMMSLKTWTWKAVGGFVAHTADLNFPARASEKATIIIGNTGNCQNVWKMCLFCFFRFWIGKGGDPLVGTDRHYYRWEHRKQKSLISVVPPRCCAKCMQQLNLRHPVNDYYIRFNDNEDGFNDDDSVPRWKDI